MHESDSSSRPLGRLRRRHLPPLLAALAGLAVGALAFGPSPASGEVATWTNMDLADAVSDQDQVNSGFSPVSYGMDGQGGAHLRGAFTIEDGEVARIGGVAGPYMAQLNDDLLPCRFWPQHTMSIPTVIGGPIGLDSFEGGVLLVTDDGRLLVGGNDLTTIHSGTSLTATFSSTIDAISWQAHDPECEDLP